MAQKVKDLGVATAVVLVFSLARKIPHATGAAKKRRKRKKYSALLLMRCIMMVTFIIKYLFKRKLKRNINDKFR